jgi:2'-hydroxyisoflavone reductase
MSLERRTFLGASLGAMAFLGARASARALGAREQDSKGATPGKQHALILGGTGFLGPALVEACRTRGHTVTLFNRGKTRPGLFPDLEKLVGDRDPSKGEGLKALEGRKFDVVFDDCGYYPRHVKASAELLGPNVKQYVYVSSISCYAKNDVEGMDETAACGTMPDPTLEKMGDSYEYYGPLKALCEQAAEKAVPGRTTVIRPGYIVGPGDGTGRFNYWPVRFDRGGEVLVPGAPTDPVQIIDVRDLAEWMVRLSEARTVGVFNACGPEKKLPWGEVIEACTRASSTKDVRARWVGLDLLEKHKGEEAFKGAEFPIWAPYAGESKGFHTVSNARAVKAGLTFRSIDAITRDTLAWWKALPADDRAKRLAGPTAEQEKAMLSALA